MHQAPRELFRFQDEPPQLPSGSFGKKGHLRLGFERRPERTVLSTLHRRAPLIVQQALYWDEAMPELPCVSMISNGGGILQGDRNTIDVELGPGAQAYVTSQSMTRIHEMDCNYATQDQTITLAEGAYLEFVPHPIVPHRNARFAQRTAISIHPTATLVYSEVLMSGRKHYAGGEAFVYDLFASVVAAERPDGPALFSERFVIEPGRAPVSRLGVMGDFHAFGNLIILTPPTDAAAVFEALTPAFDPAGIALGASRLPNDAGLIVRVLGHESAPVVAAVRQIWGLVRERVAGAPLPERFLWA
jgi:urease accessory protein